MLALSLWLFWRKCIFCVSWGDFHSAPPNLAVFLCLRHVRSVLSEIIIDIFLIEKHPKKHKCIFSKIVKEKELKLKISILAYV